jgi:hypothetical protein
MCACAGSSTDRNTRLSPAALRNCPSPGRGIFEAQRRSGPDGSRARQDWIHEHAETGKPLAAFKLHARRTSLGAYRPWSGSAVRPCRRQWWNGPAGGPGTVGHKLSAIGLPYSKACSAGTFRHPPKLAQFAAHAGRQQRGHWQAGNARVIPSAHPHSSRF